MTYRRVFPPDAFAAEPSNGSARPAAPVKGLRRRERQTNAKAKTTTKHSTFTVNMHHVLSQEIYRKSFLVCCLFDARVPTRAQAK